MTAEEEPNKSVKCMTQHHSDFSIEHILNKAGSSTSTSNVPSVCASPQASSFLPVDPYSWLQCTRYCPPKVPKTQKRLCASKRQLGRHPRIPFTSHQLSVLEEKFLQSPYLSSEEVITLARQLQLADVRVKIWFQNRRARERREKLHNGANEQLKKEVQETVTTASVSNSDTSSSVPQMYKYFPVQTITNTSLPSYLVIAKHPHSTSDSVR